jgi:hypothetical protein
MSKRFICRHSIPSLSQYSQKIARIPAGSV